MFSTLLIHFRPSIFIFHPAKWRNFYSLPRKIFQTMIVLDLKNPWSILAICPIDWILAYSWFLYRFSLFPIKWYQALILFQNNFAFWVILVRVVQRFHTVVLRNFCIWNWRSGSLFSVSFHHWTNLILFVMFQNRPKTRLCIGRKILLFFERLLWIAFSDYILQILFYEIFCEELFLRLQW